MWAALERELDLWGAAGRAATFWWRDDDATRQTDALGRLFEIAARHGAMPGIAVIPEALDTDALVPSRGGVYLQHGFAHRDHARPGEKKCELAAGRDPAAMLTELKTGRENLASALGDRFLPILVPPWNRIDPGLVQALPEAGFHGLSSFAARTARNPCNRLVQTNTHVDIVDWRGGRGFVGEAAALEATIDHLSARRAGDADPEEPTGLLTHHLVHDAACWRFIDTILERTRRHGAARWLTPQEAFV